MGQLRGRITAHTEDRSDEGIVAPVDWTSLRLFLILQKPYPVPYKHTVEKYNIGK